MFRNREKIKLIAIYSAIFFFTGLLLNCVFLILVMAVVFNGVSFSYLNPLYAQHNILYLLNLLPVITSLSGAYAGKMIAGNREKHRKELKQYALSMDRVVEFARNIEKANLNIPYVPVNGERVLESALESMRNSIITVSQKEKERNEINRISNLASAMLQSVTCINSLCEETVSFLVRNIDSFVQGAIYLSEDEGKEKALVMKASYAYDRKRFLNSRFSPGHGLVGQAALEADTIIRTEIPDDYMIISSGLIGQNKPRSLILTPLIANDIVYGVLELASFSKITLYHKTLVEELSRIIARTIATVKINQKTYDLLKESEKMSAELEYQKKQLMQNSDDLLKTQGDLKRLNSKLGEQIQEVHNTNKRSQVLLENAREVITIISEERKIVYVSPSIKSIMGYYSEELLGRGETENVHPLDTRKFEKLIKDIISFPEKEHRLQYRYITKDGEIIWMEATGKNLLSDSVIKGIVVNSSDISEQRIAAKEQRIRAKMQALSENSSDLIIRIDIFGRCTYINPVIEIYTGASKDNYQNKPIGQTDLYPSVVNILKQLLEEVSLSKQKKSVEMEFPAGSGIRVMHVNAIPEFNELGDAESVLFACHDITEAKQREEIIRKKNKSISDSINYALNIQSALMPKEEDIRKILPNSFMIYKPKDVVSGDYPCLIKKEDSIYLGAMDCTGHGVPGALMSIIGYFLQDFIIQQNKDLTAGDVLNNLHQSVVHRLKQAESGSKINDGMDAAFCKIDLKKRELHFAGAHRSLYHVSKNTLTEIKGDKYPVGSTQYRNRKEFKNNLIKIAQGDAIYFMTDGYHDQFGGQTGKQRFTSDGVSRLIAENTHLSIFQMGNLFRCTYENWKGEIPQLDDVLVIGIKF